MIIAHGACSVLPSVEFQVVRGLVAVKGLCECGKRLCRRVGVSVIVLLMVRCALSEKLFAFEGPDCVAPAQHSLVRAFSKD